MNKGVNSRDYWDRRFEDDWESNNGRSYSRSYAELALEYMPQWLIHEINRSKLRVCDWGCAEGDGTVVLANAFPAAEVIGVDFSQPAIEKAKKYYPHIDFRSEDWLQNDTPSQPSCDLLFSSHTLEHFGRPWSVLNRLSAYVTRMAVLLVPFQERELIPEHEYSFEFGNILVKQPGDFELAVCEVIDLGKYRDYCWGGRQVLLVFLRPEDPLWRLITLQNTVIRTSLEDERLAGMPARISELETELSELGARTDAMLSAKQAEMEEARMEQEKEKETVRNELELQKDTLAKQLGTARASIEEIMRSKSWRVTAPLRWAAERAGRIRMTLRSHRVREGTPVSTSDTEAVVPVPVKRIPPAQLAELRVAAIMDVFTQACFQPECELVQFRPDNWEEVLSKSPPDFLFVESAWNGNDGAWQYRVAEYPAPPGRELFDLLAWCKKIGIPTVFWNKEDPPHFDNFIKTACRFDWIFTTDANCVPRYRDRCGHERVFALPFAAQPAIHNPVLSGPRNEKICFAGAYYADRFDARRDAMELLLGPALDFDLDIYDRMHGAVGPGTENYRFPDEYRPYILGRLEYKDMMSAYRHYRAFLNVNSVRDSETMFSRRVFELLACGTPVVSTESLGVRKMFPGIVPIATNAEEARAAIAELLTDDQSWRRRSALGIRRVMQAHTYSHRLREVCETIGFRLDPPRQKCITLVVLPGPKPEATASQLMLQTRTPDRALIVRNEHADALEEALRSSDKAFSTRVVDELSGAIGQDTGVFVAFIDGGQTYGPGYLDDALLALDYARTKSTSMTAHFKFADNGGVDFATDLGPANVFSKRVISPCFVCRADTLSPSLLASIFANEILELEEDCYARSPFEFVEGGPMESNDKRMFEIRLEETNGVAQA
jgi:spore maturation protein CgeB